jgi:outer membrane protein OmpA-like peptidoglycan-associated protein
MEKRVADHVPVSLRVLGILITILLFAVVAHVAKRALEAPVHKPIPEQTEELLEPKGDALAKIYFEISSADLPSEAGGAIQTVKEKSAANPELIVLVSGYHDPSGDPERNQELAMERALSAKEALVAVGVPADRIKLAKPEEISDSSDLQEARRVDIRVQ